ncbi:M24 family metallopeptidase [Chelatococcus asaccharovorans]|uniref:Xaa-Pro aminopeptidase n=2 Tax=Chelatococcus asaccharovorans TaxID=28210 RepID=A0A2V3UGQ1_9HYPH|nr:Xaa-Pro peptidase family protein [Chelatococcus asaccharovorans]PXW64431.1 Xaa-Pro aminopeptidase [Chelatococcus asaccharovorans]CAH1665984.1 Xaa-Pro aminopeptidase [Chelatococcus asaccharovorans]CAH1681687.1 Xaa-Pro aminopeptidase [Chelatococcus asaccharovorans]
MTIREIYFNDSEYEQRIRKLREAMNVENIDVFVTTNPSNVCYLVGYFTQSTLDMMFLAVPRSGTPVLVIPEFERARFEASAVGAEVAAAWRPGDDPLPFVVREFDRRGLATGQVVVDSGLTYAPHDVVSRLISGLGATGRRNLVEEVRLVKSAAEQECLRRAATFTDAGVTAAFTAARRGATDFEVAASLIGATVRAGSHPLSADPYVCVGWRTGVPHSNRGGEVIGDGDPVWLEFGGCFARYTAPVMRCAVAGKASPDLGALADASNAVLDAILPVLRAGTPASQVAEVGRKAIDPILDRIIFHHHYGYSVGLGFSPSWRDTSHYVINEKNDRPLLSGMVFHLPLMLRIIGRYGAGFSETVIIGDGEPEVLSRTPRTLVEL